MQNPPDIGSDLAKPETPGPWFTEKSNPLEEIFRLLDEVLLEHIIIDALASSATGNLRSARQSLNSAIDSCKEIKVRGFSRASKAKPDILAREILEQCFQNPRLLGAVLRVWQEARTPLRERVANHLAKISVTAEGIDFKYGEFRYVWKEDFWHSQVDDLLEHDVETEHDDDTDPDELRFEVSLMLSLSAGALPAYPGEISAATIQSQVFLEILHMLWVAPTVHPFWGDMISFIGALGELHVAKGYEIIQGAMDKVSDDVREFITKFARELDYLECDTGPLRSVAEDFPSALIDDDPKEFETLVGFLQRFRAILPQGTSISEEKSRSVERTSLGLEIVEKLSGWIKILVERMEQLQLLKEKMEQEHDVLPAPAAPASMEDSSLEDLRESLRAEKSKRDELKAKYDTQGSKLRELRKTLKKETKAKDAFAEEVARLQERVEQLESATENGETNGAGEVAAEYLVQYAPIRLESVKDAVNQAARTYSDELLVALNSKSQDNSAFQKPDEVFAALARLATDYRDHMLNQESGFEINGRLREVCPNWFYTSRQSPTTRGRYPDWYATTVKGLSFELNAHIGRGKSHDAKSNIRIAFAWNDEESKVVVGYIGRHQKTDKG